MILTSFSRKDAPLVWHGSVRKSRGNEHVISQAPHVSALMKPVLRLD